MRVLPFFEARVGSVLRILTDRGTEFCGRVDEHPYPLFLAINDIDHSRTKVKSPQTNGICERFHKTILQECYQVTFRKKLYSTLAEPQTDLDAWLVWNNDERTHQGKTCRGRTPRATFEDGMKIWAERSVGEVAA
jgi:transposase InsO family protein